MTLWVSLLLIAVVAAAFILLSRYQRLRREAFIRSFKFPPGLFEKLQKTHPGLTLKECQLVAQGLRQFFLVYLKCGFKPVYMPSQVADDLWHAFILYTRTYQSFCERAFGRFLHHTPAVALAENSNSNAGLRRCWWFACKDENIHPTKPTRLPLLFALDAKLNIANGFRYVPDCQGLREANRDQGSSATPYCGSEFASAGVDGSTDGFGESVGGADGGGLSGGDSGGDGGGCGGGGE